VTIDLGEMERRARAAGLGVVRNQPQDSAEWLSVMTLGVLIAVEPPSVGLWVDNMPLVGGGLGSGVLSSRAVSAEMMRSILLGEDLGAPLSAHDAAVPGDQLRELGVAEWRVAAALDVLTRKAP
jgi:hypothetical protein